jgi:hypothetical protein
MSIVCEDCQSGPVDALTQNIECAIIEFFQKLPETSESPLT